jgi:gas vesicle protein
MSSERGFLKGVFWGGAVGAVIALLSSPKSGKEMREDLRQGSRKLYDEASAKLENKMGVVRGKISEVRDKMAEMKSNGQNQAREQDISPIPLRPDEVVG